jgi:RNA polymerase sigma-70 factor (ECF subfamily)
MAADWKNDVLRRAMGGDQAALVELLVDEQPRLDARIGRKLPRSLSRVISSEDLLQEVFRRAFQGVSAFIPAGEPQCSFQAWLGTIADNAVRDALRRHRTAKRGGGHGPELGADRSSVVALVDLVAVHDRTASRSFSRVEMAAAMQEAIGRLRDDDRECLTMRYLNGMPVADVAEQLNRTETAAQKLCLRALDRLREAYRAVVGDRNAGKRER